MIARLQPSALAFAIAALLAACPGDGGREDADAGQVAGAADTGGAHAMEGWAGCRGWAVT